VVKAIEQMVIKIAIVTPLMQALQAAAGARNWQPVRWLGGAAALPGTAASPFFPPWRRVRTATYSTPATSFRSRKAA
jgi:hypothetical protein